jgi:hypothetical protein
LADPATTPVQCLLLVAVPLDERAFERAQARRSDFLLGAARRDPAFGWHTYRPMAAVAAELSADCGRLGATVVMDATVADLTERMSDFSTVTVVAHVAFPSVTSEDVLDELALMRLVSESAEPEWQMVRTVVGETAGLEDTIAALNRLLEETARDLDTSLSRHLRDGERLSRYRLGAFGLLRFDRPRLDELCGSSVLRPGRGIEMAEGMITCERFVESIPDRYEGLIDLSMCNSISIGAALRRAGWDRVAVGKRKTNVYAAFVTYKTALVYMHQRAMAGRSISYEEAMFAVYEGIS